jgi:hypothetical protein
MNPRIRKLAEQAFQPINDISIEGVADRYTFEQTWFQMYNQKFAQLLIRECAPFVGDLDSIAVKEFFKHFGVEK